VEEFGKKLARRPSWRSMRGIGQGVHFGQVALSMKRFQPGFGAFDLAEEPFAFFNSFDADRHRGCDSDFAEPAERKTIRRNTVELNSTWMFPSQRFHSVAKSAITSLWRRRRKLIEKVNGSSARSKAPKPAGTVHGQTLPGRMDALAELRHGSQEGRLANSSPNSSTGTDSPLWQGHP